MNYKISENFKTLIVYNDKVGGEKESPRLTKEIKNSGVIPKAGEYIGRREIWTVEFEYEDSTVSCVRLWLSEEQ